LQTLRSVAQIDGWSPCTTMQILLLKTEGSANDFVRNMTPQQCVSLDSIEDALRRRFKRKWTLETLEQEQVATRQGAHESVDSFYARVDDLFSRLLENTPVPPGILPENVHTMLRGRILRTFVTGLRSPIMSRVRSLRPLTIAVAKEAALFEEESEKLSRRSVTFTSPGVTVNVVSTPDSNTSEAPVHRNPAAPKKGQDRNPPPSQQQPPSRPPRGRGGNPRNTAPRGAGRGAGQPRPPRDAQTAQQTHPEEQAAPRAPQEPRGPPRPRESNGAPRPRADPVCYECGELGHYANRCPLITCGRCNTSGHRPRDCPTLPGNATEPKNSTQEEQ